MGESRSNSSISDLRCGKDVLYLPYETTSMAQLGSSGMVLAEVAGPDSVAAAIETLRWGSVDSVIPTAVYVPSEYGDERVVERNTTFLRRVAMEKFGKKVLDLVWIGSPSLWSVLNGAYIARLINQFSYYSPCPGCHLYAHAVRIPLAISIGCDRIVSGERESHDGTVKLNQTSVALDIYTHLLNEFGISLMQPLRGIGNLEQAMASGLLPKETKSAVGLGQLQCVFRGNYILSDGKTIPNPGLVERFFAEFAVPLIRQVVKSWLEGTRIDYNSVAHQLLG